jgi:hypothetical protein
VTGLCSSFHEAKTNVVFALGFKQKGFCYFSKNNSLFSFVLQALGLFMVQK